jgi:hypothetical protein
VLFDLAVAWLLEHKVLLPGPSVLERFVASVHEQATARLWSTLASAPPPSARRALEELLVVPPGARRTGFDRLRQGPRAPSAAGVTAGLQRLEEVRALGLSALDLAGVPQGRLKALARFTARARAQALERMAPAAPAGPPRRLRRDAREVHGVGEGVTRHAVLRLLEALPPGVTGEYDEEVRAVVVRIDGDIRLAKRVGRLLSESGFVRGHPGTEEAVLRYLPERRSRPADWDVLDDDWAICTTCNGLSTPPVSGPDELEREIQRHTDRVHGGLTE